MDNPVLSINKRVSVAIYALLFLFLVSFLSTTGTFLYWMYYPYKPLIIHDLRILNEPKIGGEIKYEVEYSKLSDLNSTITRELVNSHAIIFPTVVSHVPVTGKDNRKIKKDVLPLKGIVPDTYYFKWSATYEVNPIRTVTISARTECFELK
jgi:hypothetical protein